MKVYEFIKTNTKYIIGNLIIFTLLGIFFLFIQGSLLEPTDVLYLGEAPPTPPKVFLGRILNIILLIIIIVLPKYLRSFHLLNYFKNKKTNVFFASFKLIILDLIFITPVIIIGLAGYTFISYAIDNPGDSLFLVWNLLLVIFYLLLRSRYFISEAKLLIKNKFIIRSSEKVFDKNFLMTLIIPTITGISLFLLYEIFRGIVETYAVIFFDFEFSLRNIFYFGALGFYLGVVFLVNLFISQNLFEKVKMKK